MALLAAGASPELVKALGRWKSDAWKAYNHHTGNFGSAFLAAACSMLVDATEAVVDDKDEYDSD